MYQRYKNINLIKTQRSNERMSQDKDSLKRHNVVFKQKVCKFAVFLTGVLGGLNVNRAAKKHAGRQNLKNVMNKF